ncbi:hypothetical protein BTO02_33585 (plasmid) [Paraburkholderia sp. SOS3]|nr:hypothetical protein BTO02_20180 [Paraburkholderia sp. SOS3]APR40478.1 hypothetical protein BTO02_33585 [Paraburkholderia sp. SOS3]
MVQKFRAAATNDGPSTYAPDGPTAAPIFGLGGQQLQGDEIVEGGIATLVSFVGSLLNDGDLCWVLLSCDAGAQQVAPATESAHAVQLGQVENIASPLPLATSASTSPNQAVNQSQVLGVAQTIIDVTASRTLGTTYTNTTGKPIIVYAAGTCGVGGGSIAITIDGLVAQIGNDNTTGHAIATNLIIPAGSAYSVFITGSVTLNSWNELR